MTYNNRLDALRALAAISVMGIHFSNQWMGWGWLGVPLFFALSGYLITSLLLVDKAKGRPLSAYAGKFFARRFLRLAPAYFLFVGAIAAVFAVTGRPQGLVPNLPYMLTYTFNFALIQPNPLSEYCGHLWSLAVEWQFYLLWPFVIWFVSERALPKLLLGIVVVSPLFSIWALYRWNLSGSQVYMLPWSHWSTMALGSMLAFEDFRKFFSTRKFVALSFALFLSGGLVVTLLGRANGLWGMRWFIGTLGYPFGMGRFGESIWGYTTIGLVSVALISLAATKSMLDPCLNLGSLQYIGRVSYGFYVFHLPVVKLVLNLLDRVNPPGPAHGLVAKLSVLGLNTIAFLLCFGITLTLAHLSYKWWETRFLRLKKKVT